MVVDLVNQYLLPAAHAKRKIITAAVFPGPTLARQMVRQDWGRFDLDAFLPMLYNVFYEIGPEWVKQERSEEHTSELQSHLNLVCRLLLEKKKKKHSNEQ